MKRFLIRFAIHLTALLILSQALYWFIGRVGTAAAQWFFLGSFAGMALGGAIFLPAILQAARRGR